MRAFTIAILAAIFSFGDALASPKGYDVDRLLQQGMPDWRDGSASAPAPQSARPLDRLPNVPAPAILPPPDGATPLTAPPPLPADAPPPPAAQRQPTGQGVILRQGSPRSTVSGAWSPRR